VVCQALKIGTSTGSGPNGNTPALVLGLECFEFFGPEPYNVQIFSAGSTNLLLNDVVELISKLEKLLPNSSAHGLESLLEAPVLPNPVLIQCTLTHPLF
jgi:hypothetical protein